MTIGIIIGIGSTQDPSLSTYQVRVQKLQEELKTTTKPYQILPLIDQNSPENWVKYFKKQLKLKDSNTNTWYRADPMDKNHRKDFLKAGIKVKILPRFVFDYKLGEKIYQLSSSTEIRNLRV
ncbi:MAG: hypothetical protein HYW45_02545 [Candidatus Daviesbacteria bacterium]|nr:MAG: hypothetical protein HYW45_02545 [Candidatus Daviesbacteria bacterium]